MRYSQSEQRGFTVSFLPSCQIAIGNLRDIYHLELCAKYSISLLSWQAPCAMIKTVPKNQQKMPYFKDNFVSSYLIIIGANFFQTRAARRAFGLVPSEKVEKF